MDDSSTLCKLCCSLSDVVPVSLFVSIEDVVREGISDETLLNYYDYAKGKDHSVGHNVIIEAVVA